MNESQWLGAESSSPAQRLAVVPGRNRKVRFLDPAMPKASRPATFAVPSGSLLPPPPPGRRAMGVLDLDYGEDATARKAAAVHRAPGRLLCPWQAVRTHAAAGTRRRRHAVLSGAGGAGAHPDCDGGTRSLRQGSGHADRHLGPRLPADCPDPCLPMHTGRFPAAVRTEAAGGPSGRPHLHRKPRSRVGPPTVSARAAPCRRSRRSGQGRSSADGVGVCRCRACRCRAELRLDHRSLSRLAHAGSPDTAVRGLLGLARAIRRGVRRS